jgi:DNA-binding transcriptional MerR regulator
LLASYGFGEHDATSSRLEVKGSEGMDIGEVSKRSGMAASALRYYEERGLIRSTGRKGLRRTYERDVLERLALLALGRAAGFSLDELARMFAGGPRPRIDRALLGAKADELDVTLRKLLALRNGLRHAARCPAPDHFQCPTFKRLLRGALAGEGRPPRVRPPVTKK